MLVLWKFEIAFFTEQANCMQRFLKVLPFPSPRQSTLLNHSLTEGGAEKKGDHIFGLDGFDLIANWV